MNSLHTALRERAPDDIVIEMPDQALTARQLLLQIDDLQTLLLRAGIDRLGLLAGNSVAWVVTDLACQFADLCLLPLPTFFADAQLVHAIRSAGVDAVLTDDPQRVIELAGVEIFSGAAVVPGDHGQHGQSVAPGASTTTCGLTLLRLGAVMQPELPADTQKITFTSGSTGTPRGVCLNVEQQLNVARALGLALRLESPRHLCLLPLSTLLENTGGVYYPLLSGGTVVVPPETETGFSGSTGLDMLSMLKAIDRHRPTSIILLPQMLVGLVAALEEGWQAPAELEFAAVGGAKVAAGLITRARELGLPVYEGYGLSETASVACMNYPGNEQTGTVGRPLAHVDVSIEAGEVVISGNSFLGYVGAPASWGKQRVATGDLGEQDADGFLHLYGRRSNVLISSFGRNISPEWIESELLLHPGIQQCIVFGDARPYCTALIATAAASDDQQVQAILDAVNSKLPDYAKVGRWHRLARPLGHADGLYTENGRPRRTAIAERFAAEIAALYPGPAEVRSGVQLTGIRPATAVPIRTL